MVYFRSIVLVTSLLASEMTAAAPLNPIFQKRSVPMVKVYQEILQIVGQVSTVYVDPPPATATIIPVAGTSTLNTAATVTTVPTSTDSAEIEVADVVQLPSAEADTAEADTAEPGIVEADTNDSSAGTSHDVDSSSNYSGEATYYSTGMGSCGIESDDSQDVVALSPEIMQTGSTGNPNSNRLCGKKIEIKHPENGQTIKATVVDTCPGCDKNDIDLSPSCFKKLAGLADGKVSVSWKIV